MHRQEESQLELVLESQQPQKWHLRHVHYCLLQTDPADKRDHVEVCPEGGAIAQEIAQRVAGQGGAALIADYGHLGEKTDTFRASFSL